RGVVPARERRRINKDAANGGPAMFARWKYEMYSSSPMRYLTNDQSTTIPTSPATISAVNPAWLHEGSSSLRPKRRIIQPNTSSQHTVRTSAAQKSFTYQWLITLNHRS